MDGRHIKVVGRGRADLLGDPAVLYRAIYHIIKAIKMESLLGPYVAEVELDIRKMGREPLEDEGGVSGVAIISTSHVAMHCWPLREFDPEREMFVLDIFSCRDFEHKPVIDTLETFFKVYGVRVADFKLNYRAYHAPKYLPPEEECPTSSSGSLVDSQSL